MKYDRCPNCNGKLAIPDKKRGQPVECPVCELEFVPSSIARSKKASSRTTKSEGRKEGDSTASQEDKPTFRSLPVPTAIAQPQEEPTDRSQFEATVPDPMLPPVKSRLDTMAPGSKHKVSKLSGPPSPPRLKRPSTTESVAASALDPDVDGSGSQSAQSSDEVEVSPSHDSAETTDRKREPRSSVAKIITTESVQPLLTKNGQLPTLQLKDDVKPKKTESSLTSNPLFVGLLICTSLVMSGLMLLAFSFPPSESQKKIADARENIRQFYEVRADEELKPFQIELREAQFAHSRGDRDSEIKSYQSVMARFHAEDRNQYTGLTGSPSWDIELEELVAILLREAKRVKKSFLD